MQSAAVPKPPTLEEIAAAARQLAPRVRETPVWVWRSETLAGELGGDPQLFLKLELFQHAGSFKVRGALAVLLSLGAEARARGVTTVSAGNHAMATAYAARELGVSTKVVMPKTASPARIAASRALGAEVLLADDVHRAFELVERIQADEGRVFVHPFEGPLTALGTATLGLEFLRQVPDLDAIVVPIGGGGLCAGVAAAVKQIRPECQVYGVEPEGADSMHRSFAAGRPQRIEQVRTIADSLGAPHAAPYSYALCRQFVDQLVRVDDDALCRAMALLFREMKLAVEPAGAASTAALRGPLAELTRGKRVGLIVCGANIDLESFARHVRRGETSASPPAVH